MNQSDETQRWRRKPQAPAPGTSSSPLPSMQQQQQGNQQQSRRTDSRDRTTFQNNPVNGRSYSGGGQGAGNMNAATGGGGGGNWNGPAGGANNGSGIVDDHVPVNGFNAKEVKDFLNNAYNTLHSSASDPKSTDKPVIYKVADNGWTTPNKSNSPWGPKQHLMANGTDLLTKLKKGVANLNANTVSPAKEEPKA